LGFGGAPTWRDMAAWRGATTAHRNANSAANSTTEKRFSRSLFGEFVV